MSDSKLSFLPSMESFFFVVCISCWSISTRAEDVAAVEDRFGSPIGFKTVGRSNDVDRYTELGLHPGEVLEAQLFGESSCAQELESLSKFDNLDTVILGRWPDNPVHFDQSMLGPLSNLKKIEYLTLNIKESGELDWERLSKLAALKQLEINCESGDAMGLSAALCSITGLEQLCLNGFDLSVRDLSCISTLKQLNHLELFNKSRHRVICESFQGFPKLERLALCGFYVDAAGLSCIQQACGKTIVSLSLEIRDAKCIDGLNGFSALTNVAIRIPNSLNVDVKEFRRMNELESFYIQAF